MWRGAETIFQSEAIGGNDLAIGEEVRQYSVFSSSVVLHSTAVNFGVCGHDKNRMASNCKKGNLHHRIRGKA